MDLQSQNHRKRKRLSTTPHGTAVEERMALSTSENTQNIMTYEKYFHEGLMRQNFYFVGSPGSLQRLLRGPLGVGD